MSAQELITEHLDLWTSATTHAANGRGKNGKIELTGIKKLRELILELAVRGKLVPQNPDDKPADELLTEIWDGNAKHARKHSSGTKNDGEHSEKSRDDFPLPEGWTWTDLNCVSRIIGGGTPKSKEPAYWSDDGIKWLTPADLYGHNEKYISSGKRDISESGLKNSSAQLLPAGTVLFSSRAPIGHVAIAKNELCTNQGFKSCIPHDDGMSEYLYYFLKRSAKHIDASASGTTFKEISGSKMARVRVALPPLAEQHRIVQKVDELMALCDRLEQQTSDQLEAHETLVDTLLNTLTQSENATELADNWARLAAHFDTLFTTEKSIDKLKQTILQLAVMGRLVEQSPSDTPAFKLLKAIEEEKYRLVAAKQIKKSKALPPVSAEEEPYRVPKGWVWSRIGSIALYTEYGTSVKTLDSINGIPVVKMGDIQDGQVIIGGQKHAPTTAAGIQALLLQKGDLLYNRTNSPELVGKTGIFKGTNDTLSFASYLIRIKVENRFLSEEFLNLAMNSPLFRETEINPHLKQQCGQANVNGTILKQMKVPLPPREEQTRIVQKVDQLTVLCDQLKERLSKASDTRSQLAKAVVEGALN